MDVVEAVALAMLNGKRAREGWPPLDQIEPGFIDGDEWRLEAADAIAAYRPLIAAEWQPIETAPRDGSYFLGYGPHETRGTYQDVIHHFMGRWTITWMAGYGEPTHWQPLPAPPTAIKETIR